MGNVRDRGQLTGHELFMLVSNHKPLMFDRFDMKDDCLYVILYGTVANNPTK